jgi:putative endonuclease
MKLYCVYILASKKRGALYVGVTSDLATRVARHRDGLIEGFTKRYFIRRLVYFECTTDVHAALNREKRLKKWRRAWKIELIEATNPEWKDLWDEVAP